TFYVATQMANRQHIAFHGDEGFIEMTCPFNSNLYEGDEVRLHNRAHSETQVFRYTGIDQYRLQVEAFVRAVNGQGDVFTLENSVKNQRVLDAIFASGMSGDWADV
ncbi:MAG: gfo/Idh/MocA family oxidoreductase, partial [Pseudomonadota bacterium]